MNETNRHLLGNALHSALGRAWIFSRIVFAGLLLLYLLSGIYAVSQNEIGVHLRFGGIINANVPPGIHYRLPWPIDTVDKVAVRQVKRMVIDDFSISNAKGQKSGPDARFESITGLDSYCITGDNNLATAGCVIQYTVLNPYEYLFCIEDPDAVLKSLACKSILHCLARMPIDEILTKGKQSVANAIQFDLQKKLNQLKTGISVASVEMNNISPPDRVAKYFSEVVKASIDMEKNVNEAQSYRNEVIPKAKAEARETIEKARGYKRETILKAEGKTQHFKQLLAHSEEQAGSTRHQLYVEAMKEIMKQVGTKQIVDNAGDGQPAVTLRINVSR